MAFYSKLKPKTNKNDKRTVERLLQLRKALAAEIPQKTHSKNLLLATWNIRDFDKPAYGSRLQEAIYYIAEIIDHFDLVAVQEVYRDLEGLNRVLAILGGHWKFICTDATEGSQGNGERMAFLYDSRKVSFGGLAGELVLPPIKDANGDKVSADQVWRTPYIAGFRAGWSKFMLTTVHILWGGSQAEPKDRVNEIEQIAKFLKDRTNDKHAWARNLVLLGDFNIFNPDDTTFKALTDNDFVIPEEIQKLPANAKKNRHYDQIAFRVQPNRLDFEGKAGVFDFFQTVFKDTATDKAIYMPFMENYELKEDGTPRSENSKKNYYQTYWRTHQMSDHLPMWVELKIDYSDEYLQRKLDE